MEFYLGTPHPNWLARTDVPLCVSRRSLTGRKTLPRARGRWLLDSGGFSELSLHGRWTLSSSSYVAEARRFHGEVGGLVRAAPQDWMCEPMILARTGLTVADHQARTITNLLELRALSPELPWFPVLQGWTEGDYLAHAEAYDRAGIDLRRERLVGVGTVCRRQQTGVVADLLRRLLGMGLRLHGFGVKTHGLRQVAHALASADSQSWSVRARHWSRDHGGRPWCGSPAHKNCATCLVWALHWRRVLLDELRAGARRPRQLSLWEVTSG